MRVIEFDGKEYYEVSNVTYKGNKYSYIVNTKDEKDMCIRKNVIEDGEEYFETLDSDEEFNEICALYSEVILQPLLQVHKDEADARYTIIYSFNPQNYTVSFKAIKERNPKYAIERMVMDLCEIDSYELEKWYNKYSSLRSNIYTGKWIFRRQW